MPSTDYGIQLTRDDGRVLFDSRTWGPAVYDVVNTADLVTTQADPDVTTRRATLQYPALVTVSILSITMASFDVPLSNYALPDITLLNDSTASVTTVLVDLAPNSIHCTLLITGA